MSRTLWLGHMAKHERDANSSNPPADQDEMLSEHLRERDNTTIAINTLQSKIKVKNNLFDRSVSEKN